jgi:hypothetical protein
MFFSSPGYLDKVLKALFAISPHQSRNSSVWIEVQEDRPHAHVWLIDDVDGDDTGRLFGQDAVFGVLV